MAILSFWLRLLSCTLPTARPARRRSPRGDASRFQPVVESLEGRLVPSTVHWINPAGGDWADAANWDTGNLPGPGDDVVIDTWGGATITHAAGQDSVHSLTSRNPLNLSGGSLELAADSTLAELDLSGGTLTGTAQITVNGRFHWTAGTLGSPDRIGSRWLMARGGLMIDGSDEKFLDGRDLDNRSFGTVSDGPLTLHNARLDNLSDGTLRLTDAVVRESALWSGFFSNAGEVQVLDGTTLALSYVDNSGTLGIFSGWLTAPVQTATFGNSGSIHLWDGTGGLDAQVGHFSEGGSVSGPGSFRIGSSDDTYLGGEFNIGGDARFSPNSSDQFIEFTFSNIQSFSVGRELSFVDCRFSFPAVTIQARTLVLNGSFTAGELYGSSLSVGLEIDIQGGNLGLYSATVQTNTFNQSGGLSLSDSTITARTLINDGNLFLSGSSLISTTEKVHNRGTLFGSGTIDGDLVNEGTISVVGRSNQPGQLTVTGDFTQAAAGVLNLRIGTFNADASCDQLIVGGTAHLDGTLSVALMAGYVPSPGDSFQGMSFGAQSGDFANYNLPDLGDAMYLQAWSDGSGYYFTVQSNT